MYLSLDRSLANPLQALLNRLPAEHSSEPITINIALITLNSADVQNICCKIRNRNVVKLDLFSSQLNDEAASIIAEAIKTQRSLKEVVLRQNKIGDAGACALADAMIVNRQVKVDITANQMTARGAEAVVEAAVRSGREVIDLSNNQLGNAGAAAVAEKLRMEAGRVNRLILKHNEIGFQGDKDLALNVPAHITVVHRVRCIPFVEAHPFIAMLCVIFFFPSVFFLGFMKSEQIIEGCEYQPIR